MILLFNDAGPYHTETSSSICSANERVSNMNDQMQLTISSKNVT